MASVDFVINVKQKGMEVVQKYSKELEEVQKTTKKLTEENRKLDKSQDNLETSSKRSEKAMGSLRASTERTETSFKKLGATVITALAVVGTAIGKASFELAKNLNDQATMAENLGVSFGTFQAFAKLAAKSGVDVAQAYDKIYDMSKDIDEALTRGTGPAFETFKQMGVELSQFTNMNALERFERVSQILNNIADVNFRNFSADELKVKDILPVTREIKDLKATTDQLKKDGLLYTEAEKEQITKFASDMSVNFNEWQTVLGKISITILPKINELMSTGKKNSKGLIDSDGIKLAERMIISLGNAASAVLTMVGMVFTTLNYIIQQIGNYIVYLIDIVPSFGKAVGQELAIVGTKLTKWGKQANVALNDGLSVIADKVGADALAQRLRNQSAAEQRGLDKTNKKLGEQREELGKLRKEYVATEEAAKDFQNSSERQDAMNANNKLGDSWNTLKQELSDTVNPDGAVERVKLEIDTRDAELETENFFKDINARSSRLSQSVFDSMNATKDKKSTFDAEEALIKTELQRLSIQKELKQITDEQYAKLASAQYQKIIDNPLASELSILQAKLDQQKLNDAAGKYLKEIQRIQDEVSAGTIKEKDSRELIKAQLQAIIDSEATLEQKTKARIDMYNIEKAMIEERKKAAEDLARRESEINNAKVTILRDQGQFVEAYRLESEERIKIIKKEFKDTSELAERLDLETKIIDRGKLKAELDQVKYEINQLQMSWNEMGALDNGAVAAQEKINSLKTKEVELNVQLGETAKKNKDVWITNAQWVNLTSMGIDGVANSMGAVIAGTKEFGEVFREEAASIISEISKILLKRALLSIVESMSSTGWGGGTGWGSNILGIIGAAAKNHTGTIVKQDGFSGNLGLGSNETLRVLEVGEGVFTKDQMDYFGDALKNKQGGGNMKVVLSTDDATRNITSSRTSQKYWDKMSEARGWNNN